MRKKVIFVIKSKKKFNKIFYGNWGMRKNNKNTTIHPPSIN